VITPLLLPLLAELLMTTAALLPLLLLLLVVSTPTGLLPPRTFSDIASPMPRLVNARQKGSSVQAAASS
jgi:hypothetical protein